MAEMCKMPPLGRVINILGPLFKICIQLWVASTNHWKGHSWIETSQHDNLSKCLLCKSQGPADVSNTLCWYPRLFAQLLWQKVRAPKNTGINTHIDTGREQINRRTSKALFLISSNKQVEGRLPRERPQGAAWQRPTFTTFLHCWQL